MSTSYASWACRLEESRSRMRCHIRHTSTHARHANQARLLRGTHGRPKLRTKGAAMQCSCAGQHCTHYRWPPPCTPASGIEQRVMQRRCKNEEKRLFVRGKSAACHHAAVVLQPVYQPQTLNNQLITRSHDHTYDIFSLPTLMVVIS